MVLGMKKGRGSRLGKSHSHTSRFDALVHLKEHLHAPFFQCCGCVNNKACIACEVDRLVSCLYSAKGPFVLPKGHVRQFMLNRIVQHWMFLEPR